jgi:hypothetical protein
MVWLMRMAWGVGALLLLGVVTGLALPVLIKWQLPLRASEVLGRALTVGEVGFKPWSLELTVGDLAIAGLTAGAEPLLTVKRIHVDVSLASLLKRAPVIEALEIDAMQMRISRTGEGHYDIDDLMARFAPKAGAPAAEPARFALYNLQVRDAQLRFDDRPVSRVHTVDAIQLALPFVSNLPAAVEVKVEPRLAFKLGGTAFDSSAQATPFAQRRSGALNLKVTDLDLLPYLPYLPAVLPVRLMHGSLSADVSLQFELPLGAAPTVALKGSASSRNLALSDAVGQPVLAWQRLQLGLRDLQPLAHKLAFETLRVEGLQVQATRDAAGKINLLELASTVSDKKPSAASAATGMRASGVAGAASAAGPAGPAKTAAPDAAAWQLSLEAPELADARVRWNDATVKPAAALQLDGLSVRAKQVRWPITAPIAVTLSGALHSQVAGSPALAEFSIEGPVTDREAKLSLKLDGLSLAAFAPYLAQAIAPSIEGRLAAQAQLDWSGAADTPRLKLALDNATLDAFKLREGQGRSARDLISMKQLNLANVQLDVLAHEMLLGNVRLMQPFVALARDADGRLSPQRWVHEPDVAVMRSAPPPAALKAAAPIPSSAGNAWRVRLQDLLLDGGHIMFSDAGALATGEASVDPLRVELTGLRVGVQGLEWHGQQSSAPFSLQLSARIGAPKRDKAAHTGVLDYKGRVGMNPLLASGNLRVQRFPVHLFAPYFADQARLTLLRAEAGYAGSVSLRQLPTGFDVNAAGDVLLGDVHVATLPDSAAPASVDNTDELLSWQTLALKGLKLTMKPRARPQVEVGEIALSDFYSRLIITEQGRFNLQEVAAAPPAPAGVSAPADAASSATLSEGPGLPIDIKLGITKLTNGRIDFTDRFVRPGYSAALTELNGQIGAFSSGSREMATLNLRGRAAGTALLEINGQVNPTVKPLALDIRAKATDLELAPLSTYAGKYAGYAIERGKLSMELAYKIDADGKLDAKNQVILNQLTFGSKIDSPVATKLPVLLAVALLKDSNGVIDINLPVSGSVNDPKFSVGAIIWKVILNLLTKALTSPFSLLAGGAGSDALSLIEFRPGTALVTESGASAINKVAKALTDKPALKMTVTGAADPASEREAFQSAAIETRLLAEKRREALRSGAPAEAASAPLRLAADERAQLLKQVYEETDLPNKPRNALGFAKDIPGSEMEALLKVRMPVSEEAMSELALRRGIAVRDALIAKGLPSERLFLAAPKLRAPGEANAAWTPRVQLSLSVR